MKKSCLIFGWKVLFDALSSQRLNWCCSYVGSSATEEEIRNTSSFSTVVIGKSPVLGKKYGIKQSQKIFESEISALLETCTPARVIYVSSVAVYGNADKAYIPFSEDSAVFGKTPYAVEKILTEKNLHQLSVKLGFQLLILRPSGLFGLPVSEKRRNLIDRLKDASSQKSMLSLKIDDRGEQIRDFCEFQFLVDVIKFFMEQKQSSGVYNVASTGCYKIRELIETFGCSQNVEYLPSKTKLIHNCVQTEKLMHELSAGRASKKLIETLERRDDKISFLSWE